MPWYKRLKFARKVKGWTLRQAEQKTGISNSYLSQLENGKVSDPGFFVMVVLLKTYNLKMEDIL